MITEKQLMENKMITERQQARHDIDVCKASLKAVIKQVSSIKGAYQEPINSRVLEKLLVALSQLNEIYDEDWAKYAQTATFINDIKSLNKLRIK